MPCYYVDLGDGAYAHGNGDMSNPESAKAIRALLAVALEMLKDKETENERSTA